MPERLIELLRMRVHAAGRGQSRVTVESVFVRSTRVHKNLYHIYIYVRVYCILRVRSSAIVVQLSKHEDFTKALHNNIILRSGNLYPARSLYRRVITANAWYRTKIVLYPKKKNKFYPPKL